MNGHHSNRNRIAVLIALSLAAAHGFATATASALQGASSGQPRGSATMSAEFPDHWYFYQNGRPARFRAMEGKPAPKIEISTWHKEAFDIESLEGKVVVVDFWGTWCPPCVAALPKNVAMAKKYADRDDFAIVGVHDPRRGWNNIGRLDKEIGFNYPVGLDAGTTVRDWQVTFWPTYAVIDRAGVVRAIGLFPDRVESVVTKLLDEKPAGERAAADEAPAAEEPAPATSGEPTAPAAPVVVDDSRFAPMLEGNDRERARLAGLMRRSSPPPLAVNGWLNAEAMKLDDLRGKVVLLDFWATWCKPCIDNIPKLNDLHAKYGDKGLVAIGVCHPRNIERMSGVVESFGIAYPVCADRSGKTGERYGVDSYPDYYLIDRAGRLRVADLQNHRLEDAVRLLLSETAPADDKPSS